jgi:hypothetical protein
MCAREVSQKMLFYVSCVKKIRKVTTILFFVNNFESHRDVRTTFFVGFFDILKCIEKLFQKPGAYVVSSQMT